MAETEELFTVKLWREVLDEKQTEWRGKIQHVGSGEVRYFRDWTHMMEFIDDVLTKLTGRHRMKLHISSFNGRFPTSQIFRIKNYLKRKRGDWIVQTLQERDRGRTRIRSVLSKVALVSGFVVIALVSFLIGWHQFATNYTNLAGAMPQKGALFMGAFQVLDKLKLRHQSKATFLRRQKPNLKG
jgi:hypothetical protein